MIKYWFFAVTTIISYGQSFFAKKSIITHYELKSQIIKSWHTLDYSHYYKIEYSLYMYMDFFYYKNG